MWGVFIFDEHVRSRLNATMAIILMMTGLWGMSFFSSPVRAQQDDETSLGEALLSNHDMECAVGNDTESSKWHGLSNRQIGLLCAVIDGVWGGSILVPMHFAK